MPLPVVLDVDTGIDDALAILFAIRSPELELLACGTVAGNVDAWTAARNTLRVLEVAGARGIPVAVGCDRPLAGRKRDARRVHGADGLGNTNQPAPRQGPSPEHAVDQLLRLTRERPGEITIVAVGPLTNLAVALAKDPDVVGRVRQVIVMAGAVRPPGNVTPVAEANVAHDPEAAHAVFSADWPLLMVGLDVTMRTTLTEEQAAALGRAEDPVARFAWSILQFYLDRYSAVFGRRQCPLHDPLAVGCAVDRSWVETRCARVRVELTGRLTRGMTVVDLRPGWSGGEGSTAPTTTRTEVCLDVRADRFVPVFLERLGAATGALGLPSCGATDA